MVVIISLLALAMNLARPMKSEIFHLVFWLMLFIFFLNSLRAFQGAKLWKKRGGAAQKLIPRARGRAFGYLSAIGLLAIYYGTNL